MAHDGLVLTSTHKAVPELLLVLKYSASSNCQQHSLHAAPQFLPRRTSNRQQTCPEVRSSQRQSRPSASMPHQRCSVLHRQHIPQQHICNYHKTASYRTHITYPVVHAHGSFSLCDLTTMPCGACATHLSTEQQPTDTLSLKVTIWQCTSYTD
jgi:hypothetical protein